MNPSKLDEKIMGKQMAEKMADIAPAEQKTHKLKPDSKHAQGECPCCGAELWDHYGKEVLDGQNLYFPYTCPKCGFEGHENYYLDFINHN